ncbi:unnamed protein product [Clavelina lepadiformis]|uniref:Uncharacterized protein n=1 Tax=Clavelina lepadiformis TaxID=159417 RepID=A0ABP0H1C0_CLALP
MFANLICSFKYPGGLFSSSKVTPSAIPLTIPFDRRVLHIMDGLCLIAVDKSITSCIVFLQCKNTAMDRALFTSFSFHIFTNSRKRNVVLGQKPREMKTM